MITHEVRLSMTDIRAITDQNRSVMAMTDRGQSVVFYPEA
jgi:hypothetical protein